MRSGRREAVRAVGDGAVGRGAPAALPVVAVAVGTAGVIALAGGGDAFWLSLPGLLYAVARCRTRAGAVASAVTVAAPAVLSAAVRHSGPLPPAWLIAVVLIGSVTVLVGFRERLEDERDAMRHFALTDSLTGAANRRSLLARVEYEIARHSRADHEFALVMLDLDGFKLMNDRFGHAAGDDLLRDVATALKRAMRAQDTVARLGGDEFCVLAPETGAGGTRELAARVARAAGDVNAGLDSVRASVGIAVFPADGLTTEALLRAADQRLLGDKRDRRYDRAHQRAA